MEVSETKGGPSRPLFTSEEAVGRDMAQGDYPFLRPRLVTPSAAAAYVNELARLFNASRYEVPLTLAQLITSAQQVEREYLAREADTLALMSLKHAIEALKDARNFLGEAAR